MNELYQTKEGQEVIERITAIVEKEDISEKEVALLEKELGQLAISPKSIFTPEEGVIYPRGFNQWHDLGKGWKFTTHRPHGSDATKYHIHVRKGNDSKTEAKEALDKTSTHGRGNTMNDKKVPRDIQNKVRSHKDFKKALEEEAKAKKAKKKMREKKLNLNARADVIIAIGIFVAVVGIVLFAPTSIPAWGAILVAL